MGMGVKIIVGVEEKKMVTVMKRVRARVRVIKVVRVIWEIVPVIFPVE